MALLSVDEVTNSPADITTTNNLTGGNNFLGSNTFLGSISEAGDVDWIRITFEAGVYYRLAVYETGPAWTYFPSFDFYDAAGLDKTSFFRQTIEVDYGSLSQNGNLMGRFSTFLLDTTETWYVAVDAFGGQETGTYEIILEEESKEQASVKEMAHYLRTKTDDFGRTNQPYDTSEGNQVTYNVNGLNKPGKALARAALDMWESVVDIKFVKAKLAKATLTFTDNPAVNATGGASGVNIPLSYIDGQNGKIGGYGYLAYLHEIGHALGLSHQGDYGGGQPTFYGNAKFSLDSYQMTVMSYFSQDENPYVRATSANPITPMSIDIVAIQELYGAARASADPSTGKTVYGVNQTIGGTLGDYFDAWLKGIDPDNKIATKTAAFTIRDRSGTDTVNFRTDTQNQKVNLGSGNAWDVYGDIGTVVVAPGTVLENYVAGSGNDRVVGNKVANKLIGNDGNDVLLGKAGADNLLGGKGNDRLVGGGGDDVLNGGKDSDILVGRGGADLFRFRRGDGTDVVRDFIDDSDTLDLKAHGDTAAVLARATQSGADVVFSFSTGDSVTVLGTTIAALSDDILI